VVLTVSYNNDQQPLEERTKAAKSFIGLPTHTISEDKSGEKKNTLVFTKVLLLYWISDTKTPSGSRTNNSDYYSTHKLFKKGRGRALYDNVSTKMIKYKRIT